MHKKALFLQKKQLLDAQLDDLNLLFRQFLPDYEPWFATSATDVDSELKYHLVITSFFDFFPDVMKKIRKPEHLHFTGSGTDKLREFAHDLDLEGVRITSSAGVNAVTIAEHVLGGILTFAKNMHLYRDQQSRKVWKRYWHTEVYGQSAAIIGMGYIGREVARRCSAMGMHVTGCVRTDRHIPGVDEVRLIRDLSGVVSVCDYVVMCVPLTQETFRMMDRERFSCFKENAVFVNVSRGEVVDEKALTDLLRENRIKGAVLDVFDKEPLPEDHPFWELDNVLLTPHVAGTTQYYMQNMFRIIRKKLDEKG